MLFNKNIIAMALLAPSVFAGSALRTRALSESGFDSEGCATEDMALCKLVNLETKDEITLDGSNSYDPKDSNAGWAIKCEGLPTRNKDTAPDSKGLNFVKWAIPGKDDQTQYDPDWWINGDNSGARPNAEPYLAEGCGLKTIDVSFHTWDGGREFPCFTKHFDLKAQCEEPACPVGKKLVNGYCVCTWCNDDFHCPANSSRKPNRECYNNFHDCQCDDGLIKEHGQCVEKPVCPVGKKLVNGYCVCTWCNYDFHCPANSSRKPNRECYNNFDDCQCDDGLVKEHGQCVEPKEYICPANSHKKRYVSWCKSSNDCQCNYGYYMKYGKCVKSSWCFW